MHQGAVHLFHFFSSQEKAKEEMHFLNCEPAHDRLLAAPLRGSPLCIMETGTQFVRIIAFTG